MEEKLPKRKPTRLKNHHYGANGAYFITICTQKRRSILSKIVGEGSPLPQLSEYGKITEKWIREIPLAYPQVSVDCYVIMPNHIHLLLTILNGGGRGDPSPTAIEVAARLKYKITQEINGTREKKEKIFQRSFHDHIIRDRDDYEKIAKYIRQNPINWEKDCFYCED